MAFQPAPVRAFPGLTTYGDQEDVKGAITATNVFSPEPGLLRVRNGMTQSGSTNYGTAPQGAKYWGGYYVIGYADGTVKVVNASSLGAAVSSGTYTTAIHSYAFASCGTALYTAFGSGTKIVRVASAGSQTQGANQPMGRTVATQMPDDRLVVAGGSTGPSAASSNTSRVWFSNAGDGETWTSTDYVDVARGDGEPIMAMNSYGGLLFVFKQTKFFVFYGNSVDANGGTVFNYRTVDRLPDGGYFYQGNTLSTTDGLFYMNRTGIWLTTGGAPKYVSTAVRDRFDDGTFVPSSTGNAILAGNLALWPITQSSSTAWLVHDLRTGDFWVWSYLDAGGGSHPACGDFWLNGSTPQVFFPRDNANGVLLTNPALYDVSTDNGTAISAVYQSGYMDFGQRGARKLIRRTECMGLGTAMVSWAADQSASYTGSSLTLGADKYENTSKRGDTFSFQISGSSGWTMFSLIPWVAESVRSKQ